ncbi:MAG: substrate-binding domain-containing protein [Actinobacteria bacterium]|nr:substrate-binding domain-containing protein [Actinomycetota bacterium]
MPSPRCTRPTIKDVAVKAGVCKTTVSHAFSGRRPVGAKLKRRILRAAKKLGYQPHYIAQTLPRGHSKTIAVLVRDLINQYNAFYLQAIEQAASARGYHVYVCIVGTTQDKIAGYLQDFTHGRADGALVATSAVSNGAIIELAQRDYPAIVPLRTIPGYEYLCSNPVDVPGAFRKLLDYLYDLGHRDFGFIWHIRSHLQQRIKAWHNFAEEKGLTLKPQLEVENVHTVEQAVVASGQLLSEHPEITALVCANDILAVGAITAARKLRLDIPANLTVTGFGGIPMGQYCTPAVTTVGIPIAQIAHIAVRNLLDRIEGAPPTDNIDALGDLELLIRESSGPPREGLSKGSTKNKKANAKGTKLVASA